MKKHRAVFVIHSVVVTVAHFCAIGLPVSLFIYWFGFDGPLPLKIGLFCLAFLSGMFGINHATDETSFCILTDLENKFREEEGLPRVGEFTPRYYRMIQRCWKSKFSRKS